MKNNKLLVIVLLIIFLLFALIRLEITVFKYITNSLSDEAYYKVNLNKSIYVITKDEDSGKKNYYSIDKKRKLHNVRKFESDYIVIYDVYGCTNSYINQKEGKVLNRLDDSYCEIKEGNRKVKINENFKDIISAISSLEHDIWNIHIIKHNYDYYVVVSLNVNLWDPYDFYKYNKDTKKLEKVYTFDGEDIIGLKVKE